MRYFIFFVVTALVSFGITVLPASFNHPHPFPFICHPPGAIINRIQPILVIPSHLQPLLAYQTVQSHSWSSSGILIHSHQTYPALAINNRLFQPQLSLVRSVVSCYIQASSAISNHLQTSPITSRCLHSSPAISNQCQPYLIFSSHFQSIAAISIYLQQYAVIYSRLQPSPGISSHLQSSPSISNHL